MEKDMSLHPETIASLFEMSRDPTLGVDERKTVVFANPAAAALLGVRAGDLAADVLDEQTLAILSSPGDQFIFAHRVGERRANISVRRLEGLTVCTWSLAQPDPPALAQGRALEELSTHLMSAHMAIDALVRGSRAEDDDALKEIAQTLYREYYRLQRTCRHMKLADSILRDSLPMMSGVTDLGALCRDLCDTVGRLFESQGIQVVFQADFGLHLTMGDSALLEDMLSNLLANSLAHCGAGDTVQVELSRREDRYVIAVRDNGSGISPEKMAGIFNGQPAPDSTDPRDGAGQGLLIARGIAEKHGGAVILESRPGQGTSVRVTLPCKNTGELHMNAPRARYRSEGMSTVLTEFAPLLDKKYYTRRMFD